MHIFSISVVFFDGGAKIGEWRSSEREENVAAISSFVLSFGMWWLGRECEVQSYIDSCL
jgi:hypothetical protein